MKLYDYEQKHLDLVKGTAAECTLFLKQNGAFPLEAPCKIAAYGCGVRYTVKGGTGSGEVNSRFSVNVEQGLKDAGFTMTTDDWLEKYEQARAEGRKAFVQQIKAEAKKAHQPALMYGMGKAMLEPEYNFPLDAEGDVAIYVVARDSGEGNDRVPQEGDIKLTATEVRDINTLQEKYAKFMLVLNVGGVVDLSPVMGVDNILILSQLGVVTGNILADILLGKVNPSGKLATTWAKWEDYCSEGDFGEWNDNHYKEGIYVGYRYFDSVGKKPLFPFGFGKSYTEFSVENGDISLEKDQVTVSAKVTNIGKVFGKEVVQAYVSAPSGKLDKEYQSLAGFAKTGELAAGESETVSITFALSDFASYDEESASYLLEKGNYIVRVGNSSADTSVIGAVALDETVVTVQARNCLGKPEFTDWVPENPVQQQIPASAKILPLSAGDVPTRTLVYDVDYPIDEKIKNLSDEELVYMEIGAFNPKAGKLDVIGSAGSSVAGSAGESTSMLKSKGIKAMVMADGPAGIRLTPQYYMDKDGVAHGIGGTMLASMEDMMDGFTKFIMKLMSGKDKTPKDAKIEEQYATAIPIGTAIAQSFNYDLAKSYGDMVGDEMERFGVHLWLAPALNIHRSIRCGRNFEYYSEDPVVAGLMAAAITEGVQAHPGCGTTIKHYAANNAETNRYANNSQASERAMREIYTKGFGIAVKKAQPHAVMTSYNLLNGQHASECRGLLEDILRCEYGYEGIIMTDWVIAMMVGKGSKYRGADAAHVAMAGGDLFMPGSKGDYDSVYKALKAGELSREQLEINATRTYRMAEKLVK